ncbi:hypothetical protein ACFL59_03280 [Planctomycetota bacterium]
METITHVTGGSAEAGTQRDLEERARVVKEKVLRDAQEIVEVLRIDFPKFLERSARERYVAAGDFVLSADALRVVKTDLEKAGAEAIEAILPKLEPEEVWLSADVTVPPAEEHKNLDANEGASATIQRIATYLRDVLQKHGFPQLDEESFQNAYRLPTWFIAGRLMVSLAESYWRNLEELRALERALGDMAESEARDRRGGDWDTA